MLAKIKSFFTKDKVFLISFVVALISMLFVLPNQSYLGYFKLEVLVVMFGLMIAVSALSEQNFFKVVATHMVRQFKSLKLVSLIIILTTFFLGMLVTNDAVLLTLVPFTIYVTKHTKQEKYTIIIVILQTLAANLGSALTPMGDPQNIYLYSKFDIPFMVFIKTMLPITLTGLVLIVTTTLILLPNHKIDLYTPNEKIKDYKILVAFTILMLSILCVVGVVDVIVTLLAVVLLTMIFFKHLFKKVDYHLLLTFTMFFIFTGNVSQINVVKEVVGALLISNTSTFIAGFFTSQVISNVPAAVLLSTFAQSSQALYLLQGVNVGAMGTIIGSLASLITYKFVINEYPNEFKRYLITYTIICVIYIVIITSVVFILK
ncbi:putative spermidine/putrescine ABC transporter, substrate binding [Paracholeplasma brassicae]|uniref:Putative spermidine/putrescine ABC transporter, substrate binding n=1 Tax=Acholeplasma brassicae TaxID=61635 RepID=U4KN22_9MOLU|nr:SLC13 family permease [Paracholeplasma brassicae]CCV65606.1 putative spermidine/putrescine ABC transporter, substrate binding [Paracholeplasma brassicae]